MVIFKCKDFMSIIVAGICIFHWHRVPPEKCYATAPLYSVLSDWHQRDLYKVVGDEFFLCGLLFVSTLSL